MMARQKVTRFQLKGVKSLEKAFLQLAKEMSDSETEDVLEEALLDAVEPLGHIARAVVRRKSGATANTIIVSRNLGAGQQPTPFTMKGFARVYFGTTPRSLGHIIEYGTVLRRWTGGRARARARRAGVDPSTVGNAKKSTGIMPAFPFMRPTWENGRAGVLDRFGPKLGARMEALAAAIGKRQKAAMEREP